MGRNPRRGNGGDPGPRSSHIAHRHSLERIGHGNHESRPVVEPLRMDSRTAADPKPEEFEADSDVLTSGYDRAEYMQTIFKQLFGYSPEIANGRVTHLLKNALK